MSERKLGLVGLIRFAVLGIFTLASVACSSAPTSTPTLRPAPTARQRTPTPRPPTAIPPTHTTSAPTPLPPTNTAEPTPEGTPVMVAEGPTNTPDPAAWLPPGVDVNDWSWVSPGLSPCIFILGQLSPFPEVAIELPGIRGQGASADHGHLCLFGFPSEGEVSVYLYAPDGALVGAGRFQVRTGSTGIWETVRVYPSEDGAVVVGKAWPREGELVDMDIPLWLPVGLPEGQWRAAAHSDGLQAESAFEVAWIEEPAISVLPDGPTDPFVDQYSATYRADGHLLVRGINFPPNTALPLGVYRRTEEATTDEPNTALQDGQIVTIDSQGGFSTTFGLASFAPGTYYVVTVLDPQAQRYSRANGYSPLVARFAVASAGPPSVVGRVLWNERPVEGARVVVKEEHSLTSDTLGEGYTDDAGLFHVSGVPPGEHVIYSIKEDDPDYWEWTAQPFVLPVDADAEVGHIYLCKGFELIEPLDGAVLSPETVELSWPAYPDAHYYEVSVFDSTSGVLRFNTWTKETGIGAELQRPMWALRRTYRWQVDALNDAGHAIGCSRPRTFSIRTVGFVTVIPRQPLSTLQVPRLTPLVPGLTPLRVTPSVR